MSSENKEEHNSTASDVKEEEDSSQVEEPKVLDDSSKDSAKEEESAKEESIKDEEDSEDDNEEEMALLDRPVEVTGCRARKKVERLEISFATPKEKQQEIPEGKGQKLGDCPRIEFQIQKNKFTDLKALHKILFNRMGSGNEIKKNIRKFCGFPFDKNSPEFLRKKTVLEKLTAAVLKHVCEVLDLERGGTKEDIGLRILDFLLNPKDSGKKVTSKKKSSGKDKKKSTEKKTKNNERKSKAKKGVSSDDDEPENQDDSTADVSDEGSRVDEDDDISDNEPKKKSNASKPKDVTSKAKAKKSVKSGEKPKKPEKKTPAKTSKRKLDEDFENSEDEPPAKKNKMPSDEDITELVKQILDAADLQEITMKKVIKQVSDAYPDFDLSHKKAFIKTTIKSVIS